MKIQIRLRIGSVFFLMLGFILLFQGCSDSDILYSPYELAQKQRQWVSLSEAIESSRFNGIIEVSSYVEKTQTQEQKKSADLLFQKVLDNVNRKGWFDVEKAFADGYLYEPEKDVTHYPNYTFLFDGENLNPEKPEQLLFYPGPNGRVLVGVMFMLDDLYQHGEQVGGPETIWHFHDYEDERCVVATFPKHHKLSRQYKKGNCKVGILLHTSPQMLHVWFVNHPEGRFATSMDIDESLVLSSPFALYEANADTNDLIEQNVGDARSHHHH